MANKKIKPNAAVTRSLFQKTFYDDNNKLVLAQSPNLPIIVWAFSNIALLLLSKSNSSIIPILKVINSGSLFTWGWLELFSGVNYFRRALGFSVLFFDCTQISTKV
jgi:hypothetical protein